MSSREALRTQLDVVRLKLQALQVENRKLKEQLSDKELELTQELVYVRGKLTPRKGAGQSGNPPSTRDGISMVATATTS